jgi:NADPH2:quinone reductase
MKAWLIDELKGIEELRMAEVPDPVPEPHEVVLQLKYAALNPADRYLAEKQYPAKPKLPHILGRDGFGTVIRSGASVTGIQSGASRAILRGEAGGDRPGTFAEQVAVPEENLIETPPGWSEEQSAGASLVYLTAYQALTMWGPLPSGAIVLVTGASGGVGVAAIQLAMALGYETIGLSRSSEKSKRLLQLGTTHLFNPQDPKWLQAAKATIAPRRVELAIDNVGGTLLPQVIETLGNQGKVSLIGRLAGPVPEFNTASLFFRRLRLGGVAVGAYSPAEGQKAWKEVVELLTKTRARPLVDSVFQFEQLPQAFARLAEGPLGKVLLKIN